jgi:iron complex transport system permease protein
MKRLLTTVLLSSAVLLAVLLIAPLLGSESIDPRRALAGESPYKEILFAVRIPRVLLAALAGGALAVAGVLFQALVRDNLADPYTLGVSSGSSLGAVLAICFGWHQLFGLPALGAAAFAGATCVVATVMAIASRGRRISSFTLLLSGVTINSLAIAVILFLHTVADYSQSFQMVRWLMGGLESPDYSAILSLAAVVVPATLYAFSRARDWNLLSVGEEWAEARGVSAPRLLRIGLLLGSLLTASVTCLTGPIGFLGWAIPHALRLRLGADHRILIPNAFLAGASFLVVCDTIARTALAPAEIPVGALTSLLAGPFFLWLLASRKRSLWL